MKKKFKIIGFTISLLFSNTTHAQDTIAAWYFPNSSADAVVDASLPINSSRWISCEKGSGFTVLPIYYTDNGADYPTISDDKCGKATGFHNGGDSAYWMVKFKTTGYQNIKVSSKQWSSMAPAVGPRDFKLQYKLSGGSVWTDLTTVTVGNDWTTGLISEYILPSVCENSSSNVSLRWLMSSNMDIMGGTVTDSTAETSIDDIVITGELITSVHSLTENNISNIYPNPSKGNITIELKDKIKNIQMFNLLGTCVYNNTTVKENILKIDELEKGVYLIKIISENESLEIQKLIVE